MLLGSYLLCCGLVYVCSIAMMVCQATASDGGFFLGNDLESEYISAFDYDEFVYFFNNSDLATEDHAEELVQFEIFLHSYAVAVVVIGGFIANAICIVALGLLVTKTFECHIYCLLGCIVNSVAIFCHPRVVSWLSGKFSVRNLKL